MKHDYNHIDLNSNPVKAPEGFFRNLEIPFTKTREEVWAELEEKLSEKPAPKILVFKSHKLVLGIAAAILVLAGVFSLLRFHTTTVYCPSGQHLSYTLPDESKVEMNAESKMSFKPLWWQFARKINFEGEGYFNVEKGKEFEVVSDIGRTIVLGTSFNIYSRDREYKVTCITGKVRVISYSSAATVLNPGYEASINSEGYLIVRSETNASATLSWTKSMFNFTARPLIQVLNEIGRQYDVTVNLKAGLDFSYTGYFSKDRPVEEVLTLVCKPFGLTFVRISEKVYEISQI